MQQVVVWKLLILLPALLFLPGFALVLYVRDRYQANLIIPEFIALSLALSVVVSSLIGFLLAEFSSYTLTRLTALSLLLSFALLLASYLRRRGTSPQRRGQTVWWFSLGLLIIIVLASVLFVGRFEAILTERDVSPYLVEGVNIADHGEIFLKNKTMSRLSETQADLVYGSFARMGKTDYISAYRIHDQKTGEVSTRYPPYYSVLIAVSYRLLGLRGTLTFFNPYLAVLALLIIVLAARRLFDEKTALAAGIVLAVNPLMVWFARYPTPEIFTQFLAFLGIYCLCLFYPRGNGWWGLFAALAFGAAVTARLDLYLILAPLAAVVLFYLIVMLMKKERPYYLLWFIVPLLLMTANAYYTHRRFNGYYVTQVGTVLPRYQKVGLKYLLPALAVAAAVALLLFLWPKARRLLAGGAALVRSYWRPALAVILLLLCLFAYLVRPHTAPGKFNLAGKVIGSNAEKVFYRMSWYFTHLGMALFILGLVLFVLYGLNVRTAALFLIGGFFSLLFFRDPACNPLHLWFMRRFIPLTVPFMAMMIGYAVLRLSKLLPYKAVKAACVALLLVLLVLTGAYTARIYPIVQYQGALNAVQTLADRFSDNKPVVFMYGTWARTYFPDLLRYIYSVDTLPLGGKGSPRVFSDIVDKLSAGGRDVYLVSSEDEVPPVVGDLQVEPVGSQDVAFKVFLQEYNRRPSRVVPFQFPLRFYRLRNTNKTAGVSVDAGKADSTHLKDGFYEPEGPATREFRWTSGSASFTLPNPQAADRLTLGISASLGNRPAGDAVPVRVSAQGREIGTFHVKGSRYSMHRITFDKSLLPEPNAGDLVFQIEVPTWTPSQTTKSIDNRQLGIAVNEITIEWVP